jgi:hypothetical protein
MSRKQELDRLKDSFTPSIDCEGCGGAIKTWEPRYTVQFALVESLESVTRLDYYHETCLDPTMLLMWLSEAGAVIISR